ncbi:S4 domain-containing protein [Marinicella sp. S1101]|uniref:RNA-binding S4 domain-containing protein n=1 Tax=Marinicella marina TaxID=2996016 RepID=UPI002260EAC7|nr:S4 domain-containing protein [Marinicella marina]MCX7553450.1 S4 domain-containing protein [Marinicella marina]MDJ1140074.1 S4 domain-containing protein [Marinicella marina]
MVRIDKWLWAARFFKTRSLAKKQVEQGKIKIAAQKIKPSRNVQIGDFISIKKNDVLWEVEVLGLAEKRGSATIAQQLYQETDESIKNREAKTLLKKMEYHSTPKPDGRPTKKQRRDIKSLKNKL